MCKQEMEPFTQETSVSSLGAPTSWAHTGEVKWGVVTWKEIKQGGTKASLLCGELFNTDFLIAISMSLLNCKALWLDNEMHDYQRFGFKCRKVCLSLIIYFCRRKHTHILGEHANRKVHQGLTEIWTGNLVSPDYPQSYISEIQNRNLL